MPRGCLLAGRYRLRELIGDGGMGRVWLAHDHVLCRKVAVKEIVAPQGFPHDQLERLYELTHREARAAAQVDHPNVVKIYDIVDSGPWPWLVMQYVPSKSLRDMILEHGPLDVGYVAFIGLSILDALVATHRAGVVHRDVTPRNVLLARDGRVMLTDFGLALWLFESQPDAPQDNQPDAPQGGRQDGQPGEPVIMGTAQYVAPERITGGESTAAGDLWALGATLYKAVEGRPPYARPSVTETLAAAATQPPDAPSRAGALAPLLFGLLQREPRMRPTAAEARLVLEAVTVAGSKAARLAAAA